MATWTTIPDSSLEPGKPIRAIDGLALRDNPIAISEGQSGAPKIVDAALSTTATNTGRDWVLARTALAEVGAVGTYAFAESTGYLTFGSTRAGSSLRSAAITLLVANAGLGSFAGGYGAIGFDTTLSGTWRCMGCVNNITEATSGADRSASLWLRIS
jgi:hypothetical protein